MLRIDLRIGDDDSVATTLNAIPRADRPAALRVLIRRHFRELPEIAGITSTPSTPTPAPTRPAPVAAAAAPVTEVATPAPAARPDRAAMARRLCTLGAHTAKPAVALGIAALLACAIPAHNARAGTIDLDVTTNAVHTRAWARRELNQHNPGLGIEYHWNRTWGLMAGAYRNSYRRPTFYSATTFTPLHIGNDHGWHLDAGVGAGIATGYTRRENPVQPLMAAGIAQLRAPDGLGVNLLWVPNQPHGGAGFVGFQLAFPLP